MVSPDESHEVDLGHVTITGRSNGKDFAAYNISDYRTGCRTCKDMEVEEYDKVNLNKKTYKAGSLLNAPNTFTKYGNKRSTLNFGSTLKPTRSSIDVDQARKVLQDAKGKIAPLPRYSGA